MKALAIVGVNLRRLVRERGNLFFMVIFPFMLILVIGAAFGGGFTPRLGVVVVGEPGPLAERLVGALSAAEDLAVDRYDDEAAMRTSVERGEVSAGLVIPADYDAAVAAGEQVELRYLVRPDSNGQQLGLAIRGIVAEQAGLLRAARFTAGETGAGFTDGLAAADAAAGQLAPVTVRTTTVGEALFPTDLGRFDIGASSNLLLFVFLNSLAATPALIQARRMGISRRMFASPTSVGTIVAGEALGRVAIALVQGAIIMLGAGLLFGVNWGDPLAAVVLLTMFALVAGGAALVMGAAFRTEQQAIAVGLMVGLGMAAIGGSMVPIELFSDTMRTVAKITPHAWANEAFAELVRHDGGLFDILPQLGVLAGYALVLFLVGGWLFSRSLTRGQTLQ
ncbi:MAG TPA: ABC transporter permease [Natronosporangium sp.]